MVSRLRPCLTMSTPPPSAPPAVRALSPLFDHSRTRVVCAWLAHSRRQKSHNPESHRAGKRSRVDFRSGVWKCSCGAFPPQPRGDPNHERLETTYNSIIISRGTNLVPPHLLTCVTVSQTTNNIPIRLCYKHKPTYRPIHVFFCLVAHACDGTVVLYTLNAYLYPRVAWGQPCDAFAQLVEVSACQRLRTELPNVVLEHEAVHPLRKNKKHGRRKAGKSEPWKIGETVDTRARWWYDVRIYRDAGRGRHWVSLGTYSIWHR